MTKNQSKVGMKYRKLPITAKIAVINSRKRIGDVTEVASRTGFSTNFVSEVLNGLYRNDRIVNKAFDMTRGRKTNMSVIG
jgi:hypothetical protein